MGMGVLTVGGPMCSPAGERGAPFVRGEYVGAGVHTGVHGWSPSSWE